MMTLVRKFRDTHAEEIELVAEMEGATLDRLESPRPERVRAVVHGRRHRGQVATRLRPLGAAAPPVDSIVLPKARS